MTRERTRRSDREEPDARLSRGRARPDDEKLATSTLFDVLAAAPRRRVLEYVLTADGSIPLREVADHLVARDPPPATDQLRPYLLLARARPRGDVVTERR
ncbi:hypothetical protein [Halomarina pelagica]|uniref:hypothetical protein n=1 Tax=Halomarina pelagica TaxID=2961599 RepID=UPI0020C53DB2|nr:hypothetical protein [Halomarina sp. BND7]